MIKSSLSSVILEYSRGLTLLEVIEHTGAINENLLNKIANQLLTCFEEYRDKSNKDYGDICMCDIYFDRNGSLKVINFKTASSEFFKL